MTKPYEGYLGVPPRPAPIPHRSAHIPGRSAHFRFRKKVLKIEKNKQSKTPAKKKITNKQTHRPALEWMSVVGNHAQPSFVA